MDLLDQILVAIDRDHRDLRAYEEALVVLGEVKKQDANKAYEDTKLFRAMTAQGLREAVGRGHYEDAESLNGAMYRAYLMWAREKFDDYLLTIDFYKPTDKQFYRPRRCYLKRYVDQFQRVFDGELDFLSLSLPKRAGKSSLGINFSAMLAGNYPDRSILMEGTGDDLVRSFYSGVLEYMMIPSDYKYYDIFPDRKLVQTNADTKILNLDHKSRFPTIMCRSIDARQVGLSEATSLLDLDDCVEGREEAKNRQRLDEKWEILSGDVLGRAIEGTPIVICGTRYSIYDPIGRMQEEMRKQGKRMMVLETPALDPITDESNFEFELEGRKIFTTKYFRDQRQMLSAEQFESEFQQQPFEAKGLLFPKDQLNYFYELPVDVAPDTIMAFCDTAEGAGDFCSMPVLAVYGTEAYVIDVMFDDSPAIVTKPECAKKLIDNRVVSATFEANLSGTYFARDVQDMVTKQGGTCAIRSKRTITNKQTRIEFAADGIIKHFWFKAPGTYERGSQYDQFMKQVTNFARVSKKQHDDAPDSLAMAENELKTRIVSRAEAISRPW